MKQRTSGRTPALAVLAASTVGAPWAVRMAKADAGRSNNTLAMVATTKIIHDRKMHTHTHTHTHTWNMEQGHS